MDFEIKNKLNIWEIDIFPEKSWYRIDLKCRSFFRKIKWTCQRAKYGWCDRDLWDLYYTLGNYIASSTKELANRTHGYPPGITEKEWDNILKNISKHFYLGVEEDYYVNPYEKKLQLLSCDKESEKYKEVWKKYSEEEIENNRLMREHLHEGFTQLEKWFPHLWD